MEKWSNQLDTTGYPFKIGVSFRKFGCVSGRVGRRTSIEGFVVKQVKQKHLFMKP